MNEITQLVTHDGKFHADEVLSSGILRALFPDAELIRTRSPTLISAAPGRIAYDVGGVFDPEMRMFDHHQNNAPRRENGNPYSSFGLIWRAFGEDWIVSRGIASGDDVAVVWGRIDRSIVWVIDALDAGEMNRDTAGVLRPLTLSSMIEDLNPAFDDMTPDGERLAFSQAVGLGAQLFEARCRIVSSSLRADIAVRKAIEACGDSPILELPHGMPYEKTVRESEADHLLFVIIPRGDQWTLSTVRDDPGTYVNRRDLPTGWAGLEGEALSAETGVPGGVFCHKGLFFAVAETREAIMEMARIAISPMESPSP